jgi:hypothetical protein
MGEDYVQKRPRHMAWRAVGRATPHSILTIQEARFINIRQDGANCVEEARDPIRHLLATREAGIPAIFGAVVVSNLGRRWPWKLQWPSMRLS